MSTVGEGVLPATSSASVKESLYGVWESASVAEVEIEGLDTYDEDTDEEEVADVSSGNPKRSAAERKRWRNLQKKPGWYRRVSRWMSKGNKKRLRALWPVYGITPPPWQVPMDIPTLFGSTGEVTKVVVDVGFGDGLALVNKALELQESAPEVAFLGCEWHQGSVGAALTRLNDTGVTNVRVLRGDFLHHLRAGWFGPDAVDEVCIFFPDPWPRAEDHERRVINSASVSMMARCLKPGGFLHVATDVREYAVWVGAVLEKEAGEWEACAVPRESALYRSSDQTDVEDGPHYHKDTGDLSDIYGLLPARPRWRPLTRYENRGIRELNHKIYDSCFRRKTPRAVM
ncbi:hypothetical protein NSK_003156 [Nannochloropsis salina CCMP1776]|jgi:tRNA (guanine-N7-)-methyltransferase|uniref:tRNA (guanine(46)-N(7))-methyltransferase n=1 Tax=Nannochloropsis salina CCMP1776 TaxID=1027361 RepID=A0A4D9DAK7_9STRA|nr:hypothetical protein NSK_003156 [Nannochloropsis salina CCMP1776]|eukprot:TFJ85648.1 hypothetical protein NSK_003156 [Nannochloropsis salina CCMP1776]